MLLGTSGLWAQAAQAAPATGSASASTPTTEAQASAQARRTGNKTAVAAATTPTETEMANPDGSFTLTQAAAPVRKRVNGTWKDLDADLQAGTDGQITPAVTTGDLHLSGGGTGPFATMAGGGRSLRLSLPFSLPKPTLTGPTATYAGVLPGVDLIVTADTQGGFSEVLVVKNATAASDPRLSTLTFATSAQGITLKSDAAGNISGTDVNHRVVATAPAPTEWDSAVAASAPATVTEPRTGLKLDTRTGLPVMSTARTAGEAAHVARLGVAVKPGRITLTPPRSLMTNPGLKWPVYIDPAWSWGASDNGYAVVQRSNPDRNYWKNSPSTQNDLQSGLNPDVGGDVRRTLFNFAVDTSKVNSTANISAASVTMTEIFSYNCTPSTVDIYGANAKMLTSSNATWNDWSNASLTFNDQVNAAYGYSSDCSANGVSFNVATAAKAAAKGNTKYQTFMVRADDESSQTGWKRWDASTVRYSITYDHTPNQPTGLKTSPTTACTGATIGDSAVKLYATVSDPDGGIVSENFAIWKDGNTGVKKTQTVSNVTSGSSSSPLTVDENWLKTNAANGTAPTKFDWNLTTTQFSLTSKPSATCSFTFDPTRPANVPDLIPPTDSTIGTTTQVEVHYTLKSSTDTYPGHYRYQLNGAGITTVDADSTGNATIYVTPSRAVNGLLVNAVSPGGNIDIESAFASIDAKPAAPRADADLNGDGNADLLTVGGANGVPSGLWLAAGTPTGTPPVNPVATDIGANGNGTGDNGTADNVPAAFNGAQVITGRFNPTGMQDILYYYPQTGTGGLLAGSGDGSPIDPNQDDAQSGITLCELNLVTFACGYPSEIANAGDSAGAGTGFPDLISVMGDAGNGYHLTYWTNGGGPTAYSSGGAADLTVPSPDGTMDWNAWSITTAQNASGKTDMFLWNSSTGALTLWPSLALTTDGNGNNVLTYGTPVTFADGTGSTFNKGAVLTLRAADINHDGVTDLWGVGAGGLTTAWINQGTTLSTTSSQALVTAAHAWQLNEAVPTDAENDAPITTAVDATGGLNATGSATGVSWNSGGLFDPDAAFDGSTGVLTAGQPAVATNTDFSISAWVKPTAYNGAVISQDSPNGAALRIWPSSDTSWDFAMEQSDKAYSSAVWDTAQSATGAAQLGAWYHITATYQASAKKMSLYVNDRLAAVVTHSPLSTTGSFRIGAMRTSSTAVGNYYKGEVANVQAWKSVIQPLSAPAAPAAAVWRAYGTTNPISSSTSTWHCGSTGTVATDVLAQGCVVRSPGGLYVQAAVIVRNNRTSLYGAEVTMDLENPYANYASVGAWQCGNSGVGAGTWSVCFGPTFGYTTAELGYAEVNGTLLIASPVD